MCLLERNTARRGRSAVPRTYFRTRLCRRSRATCFCLAETVIGPPPLRSWSSFRPQRAASAPRTLAWRSLGRLSGLAANDLAGVAHAFALVGLGLAQLADVGRHLSDGLLVVAAHGDAGRCRHLEGH